jgi:hypothetical protein
MQFDRDLLRNFVAGATSRPIVATSTWWNINNVHGQNGPRGNVTKSCDYVRQ